ncbi:hypothetical protein [Bradyrhizobium sp. B120]
MTSHRPYARAADTLISPPLIMTENKIEAIFAAIRRALHAIE